MGYVPSVVIDLSAEKKWLNALKSCLPEKYYKLLTECNKIDELDIKIQEIQKLRGQSIEGISFADTPLCNLIFIGGIPDEKIINGACEKYNTLPIQRIFILQDLHKEYKKGTRFYFSLVTNKNERLEQSEMDEKILSFLIILICSKIYEDRDYDQWFLPEGKTIAMGIESSFTGFFSIKEFLKAKFIYDLLEYALKDSPKDTIENLNKVCEDWFKEKSKLDEPFDQNKIIVPYKSFNPELFFFTTRSWRERKIKDEYPSKAKEIIKKYLMDKKQKAFAYRKELEQRIFEKLKTDEGTLLDDLGKKVDKLEANLKTIENTLTDLIKEDGILKKLAKNKKNEIKWETLINYLDLDFSKITSPHPNWKIMGILLILSLLPFFAKIIFPPLSFKLFFYWLMIVLTPLAGYIIFSKLHLSNIKDEMLAQWKKKMEQIDKFFETSFTSLPEFYSLSYLLQFYKRIQFLADKFKPMLSSLEKIKEKNSKTLEELKKQFDDKTVEYLSGVDTKDYLHIRRLLDAYKEKKNCLKEI
ncbi:MAG: hypothetical protein ACUVQT_06895, partial [bacterium]